MAITLNAQTREVRGRKVKAIRAQNLVPAVLYGPGLKSASLAIQSHEFERAFGSAGFNSLVDLRHDNGNFRVFIHALQRDPLNGKVLHTDFYQPRMDAQMETKVPVRFLGESPAVRDFGGVLVKNVREVAVKALPSDMPHELQVDLNKLVKLNQHVLIKDIVLPQGVTVAARPDEVVVVVTAPRREEVVAPQAATVETAAGVSSAARALPGVAKSAAEPPAGESAKPKADTKLK